MTALSSYSTGTVAVSADGTTAVGTSTLWLSTGNVKPGDELAIGHFRSRITDVTDDTHLVITPWPGSTVSGSAYTVWKLSLQRVVGETYARDVDKMVGALNTSGYFVFVDIGATAPDPSLGDDGQFAFQPTTGKTWSKSAGVWSFLGVFKAFNLTGAYNGATVYSYGDVQVTSGSSYIYINATPSAGHAAPNATYWQLLASVGSAGPAPWSPPAAWVTSHGYVAGPPADVVTINGSTYVCLVSHTSGTFATDLAAAKWLLVAQAAPTYGGTSTTSLAIGTGSKAFTTQAGLAYTNGARVRATATAGTTGWLEGVVTYSGTTLTITSDKIGGSGTGTAWNLNVTGEPGAGDLSSANNLSDLANAAAARLNLGLDQNQRVNSCLDRIYASKLHGAYRRGVNVFADGYKASDGINTGASSNYVVNPNTSVSPTTSGTSVTIDSADTTAGIGGFTVVSRGTALVNGVTVYSVGVYSTAARAYTVKIVKRNAANNYDVVVSQSFSHPGGGWADAVLSSSYTVPGSGTYYLATYTASGTVDAKLATLRAFVSGDVTGAGVTTTGEDGNQAFPLRYMHTFVAGNMTVVTVSQTADASVSSGRVLLEFDNSASPTLNTDLTVEVTCNGGTNWTAATLSTVSSNSQGGRKLVETVDQACTSGTSFAARIKTLNNKNVPIYGVSLMVH